MIKIKYQLLVYLLDFLSYFIDLRKNILDSKDYHTSYNLRQSYNNNFFIILHKV